jgi:hypothetical protein
MGVNMDTLFNNYDVMNPSYNDEVEEEDNPLRIVIGYRRIHNREQRKCKRWLMNWFMVH